MSYVFKKTQQPWFYERVVFMRDNDGATTTDHFILLKFIYSEKATKFCRISTLLLSVCAVDKCKEEIFFLSTWKAPFWTKKSQLKFIYSEKATNFCKISNLLLSVCTVDKCEVEISQNFVAFSEYTNFTKLDDLLYSSNLTSCQGTGISYFFRLALLGVKEKVYLTLSCEYL